MNTSGRDHLLRAAATVGTLFGALTVAAGGRVLFGGDAPKVAAGATVSFVLWFNFLAGFCYVAAGAGLWFRQRWAAVLSALIALSTVLVFAAFGVHVWLGGDFETRTVAAMTFRALVWAGIAWLALLQLMARR